MTKSEFNNEISGNVDRLIQIGTVNGPVFIVSDDEALRAAKKVAPAIMAEEITDFIHVIVNSARFARKLKLRVPHELTIGALVATVIEAMGFSHSDTIEGKMLTLEYEYSIVFDPSVERLSTTLKEAGVVDGSELELRVDAELVDDFAPPERKREKKKIFFDTDYNQEIAIQFRVPGIGNARPISRGASSLGRERPTKDEIEKMADGFFKFVDEVPAS